MGWEEVMRLPVRAFWMFNRNIQRVSAEKDLRAMRVHASASSGEAIAALREALVAEIGSVTKQDPLKAKLDREALNELRTLM
jgi:hypothetical protein